MDQNLPSLIHALLEPQRYPDATQQVELIQTHISWLLLAGAFAYKIKKPVRLSFLDFSTLAQRQLCCQEELRLNRRFASDIYLDVVGIFNTPQDPRFSGPGPAIEYAVKMRRFDEAGRLDRVCDRGELRPLHLSDLTDTLVAFHAAAEVAPPASRLGSAEQVLAPMLQNFDDLLRLLPTSNAATRLASLRSWTESQFKELRALLEARKRAGRVRECHGDLHLANLVLIDQKVRMFDCIEFSEELRWIDVASEIAFSYVDLLAHGRPELANWFVNEVLSRSGDYEAALVLRFYGVYRSLVRAKVAAIRMARSGDDDAQVVAFLALAERLVAPLPLRLVITHGLSGCGKTVASTALMQSDPQASTLRLRSDVQRKRLFALSDTAPGGPGVNTGLYAPAASTATYSHLRELAALLLRAGWSVCVDATFLKRAEREIFRRLARETGAAFSILAPQATPAQLRDRIQARMVQGQDASEATLEVLEQQLRTVEPLQANERLERLREDPAR